MSRQKIWDFWAKGYEGLWVQKYSLTPTRREILLYLEKHLEKDKRYRILDVGCGIGQLLREIQSSFQTYDLELIGIDFSKEMIQRAETMGTDISYKQVDVEDIEILEGPFDIILCTHSFPYYKDQPFVLRQFRRLMQDDGCLLLAQASQNNLYDHVMMFFVKFTTGKAGYPSVKAVEKMAEKLFLCRSIIKIKERFFMPSIYFFVLKGDQA